MTIERTRAPPQQNQAVDANVDSATFLICRVGRQLHAVPIQHVVEVMRAMPVETIANAPGYVRGVCIIRGAPTPVVDTGLLVGEAETRSRRLVEVRTEKRVIALLVEDVLGIRTLQASRYEALPPLLRDLGSETITGIGLLDSSLLLILRLTRVVPEELFNEIDRAEAQA